MDSLVKAIAVGIGKGLAVVVLILIVTVVALIIEANAKKDRKIHAALEAYYTERGVVVERKHEGPVNQLCLEIRLRGQNQARDITRFAAVNGDSDGGVWLFAGEYESMASCKKSYDLG